MVSFAPADREIGQHRAKTGRCPSLWVYRNANGVWCVRKEGALRERIFDSPASAMSFARAELARATSYRLFIVRKDGRVTEEMLNPARHSA